MSLHSFDLSMAQHFFIWRFIGFIMKISQKDVSKLRVLQDVSISVGSSNEFVTVLESYLKYCFVTLTCPFYVATTFDENSRKISTIREFVVIKAVNGFLTVLAMFWVLMHVRQGFPSVESSPTAYLNFAVSIAGGGLKTSIVVLFLTGRKRFQNLHNFLLNSVNFTVSKPLLPRSVLNLILCFVFLLYIFVVLVNIMNGYGIKFDNLGQLDAWEKSSLRELMCNISTQAYQFGLPPNTVCQTTSEMSNLLAALGLIGYLYWNMLTVIPYLILAILPAILWLAVKKFTKELEKSRLSAEETFSHYKNLKQLSRLIDDLISTSMLWHVVESTVYYSTMFEEAFSQSRVSGAWTGIVTLLAFFSQTAFTLYFSADSCHQVYEWLCLLILTSFSILNVVITNYRWSSLKCG